jgi:hypothetical protein
MAHVAALDRYDRAWRHNSEFDLHVIADKADVMNPHKEAWECLKSARNVASQL